MSIKSDRWIRERSTGPLPMIEPFEPGQVRADASGAKIVSFGTSSYGYDVRCADEFKIFTNINSSIVDPKAFDEASFVDVKADTCIIPPNSFALARTIEYFRIPRNVLTVCLGKSTYARCFSADTRVALVDGRSLSFEQMVRGSEAGERFFGYGLGPLGKVMVTELEAPRRVGSDALLEVGLDDGSTIRATPDHEFVMRDGTMLPASELRSGASLMPLYRSLRRGCEMTFQPLTGHMHPTHRMADDWNVRHGVYDDEPGTHRHHVNFCRTDNSPWNVERMEASCRITMHNARTCGLGFGPEEHGLASREALRRLRENDLWYAAYRKAQSARAREFWSSPRHAETRVRLQRERTARWTPGERELQRSGQEAFRAGNDGAGQLAGQPVSSRLGERHLGSSRQAGGDCGSHPST